MKELILILPNEPSFLLNKMIEATLDQSDYKVIRSYNEITNLQNKKIIFAIELNEIGTSNTLNSIFEELYKIGRNSLENSEGCILIHTKYNSFTKTLAQNIIYLSNNLGCSFEGRAFVEATGNLDNFIPMQVIYKLSLEEICLKKCKELGDKFLLNSQYARNRKLLLLHSSDKETSNTLRLWEMVKTHLIDMDINEIYLGNGSILDCNGCSYKTCKYYGKQNKCYYGGIVVEEVYPAILEASTVVLLCPNYNDMLPANLVATINRLTALFRMTKFYDKNIYSIVVSGYSGGDALVRQIISSLNMNKTFNLPPYFSLLATANDKDSIYKIENIQELAMNFASNILKNN